MTPAWRPAGDRIQTGGKEYDYCFPSSSPCCLLPRNHHIYNRMSVNGIESRRSVKDAMESNQTMKEVTTSLPTPSSNNANVTISVKAEKETEELKSVDHRQSGQWLRAAVLGANDGLITTAPLMMGVGAVKTEAKIMAMSGLAALIAGACSMAIGEFISVQTQRDSEISTLKRNKIKKTGTPEEAEKKTVSNQEREALPNPVKAACASACAFALGALVPLLSGAFIENFAVRIGVLAGVSSLALVTFGALGAYFGRASLVKGGLRVLAGGWIAMAITYGVLKLFPHTEGGDDL